MKIIVAFVVGLFVLVGAALATPGIGVVGPIMARGTNADELNIHSAAGIKLKTKGALDFVTQQNHDRDRGHDRLAQPSRAGVGDGQVGGSDVGVRGRSDLSGADVHNRAELRRSW